MPLIPLAGSQMLATVDDSDYEMIIAKHWRYDRGRATHFFRDPIEHKRRGVMMHRLLLAAPSGLVVDHIDHDQLNNRRCNLRLCTQRENARNVRGMKHRKSRFKGVVLDTRRGKYGAYITVDGRGRFLGYYIDEEDAGRAYDAGALKYFGEFAYLNFGTGA